MNRIPDLTRILPCVNNDKAREQIQAILEQILVKTYVRHAKSASSGNVTDEIIKQYIESQGDVPETGKGDDNFGIGQL